MSRWRCFIVAILALGSLYSPIPSAAGGSASADISVEQTAAGKPYIYAWDYWMYARVKITGFQNLDGACVWPESQEKVLDSDWQDALQAGINRRNGASGSPSDSFILSVTEARGLAGRHIRMRALANPEKGTCDPLDANTVVGPWIERTIPSPNSDYQLHSFIELIDSQGVASGRATATDAGIRLDATRPAGSFLQILECRIFLDLGLRQASSLGSGDVCDFPAAAVGLANLSDGRITAPLTLYGEIDVGFWYKDLFWLTGNAGPNKVTLQQPPNTPIQIRLDAKTSTLSWNELSGSSWSTSQDQAASVTAQTLEGESVPLALSSSDIRSHTAILTDMPANLSRRSGLAKLRLTLTNPAGVASGGTDWLCTRVRCVTPNPLRDAPNGLGSPQYISKNQTQFQLTYKQKLQVSPEFDWLACPTFPTAKSCDSNSALAKGTVLVGDKNATAFRVPWKLDRQGRQIPYTLLLSARFPHGIGVSDSIGRAVAPPLIKTGDLEVATRVHPTYIRYKYTGLSAGTLHVKVNAKVFRNGREFANFQIDNGYGIGGHSLSISSPGAGQWSAIFTACGPINCAALRTKPLTLPVPAAKPSRLQVSWPSSNAAATLRVPVTLFDQYGEILASDGHAVLEFRFGRSDAWQRVDEVAMRSGRATLLAVLNPNGFYRVRFANLNSARTYVD